jgi:hypothetical protein
VFYLRTDLTMDDHTRELALETYRNLAPEIAAVRTQGLAVRPSLEEVLAEAGPLPPEALFLGLAGDGLPVLLNLYDPAPGPLLVAADAGAGKTLLLKNAARALTLTAGVRQAQFAVVTSRPEPWQGMAAAQHCIGVFPSYHNASGELLASLVSWAHANKGGRQIILLLVDDLAGVEDTDADTRQALRFLLLRGPARRVWPLVAMDSADLGRLYPWLDSFRTRIFGHMADARRAADLAGVPNVNLTGLQAGEQYAMREGKSLLKFWIPK